MKIFAPTSKMVSCFMACVVAFCGLVHAESEPLQASLFSAAEQGDTAQVRSLLESGADANACNEDDDTAFWLAVRGRHEGVMQMLLQYGANPYIAVPSDDWEKLRADGDLHEMIQREFSLRYLAELLRAGNNAYKEHFYRAWTKEEKERLQRCEPELYAELTARAPQIDETVESCRRWQEAVMAFVVAWRKIVPADHSGRYAMQYAALTVAGVVQYDARALAAAACWYPSYIRLSKGISGGGSYDRFRLPDGAPEAVRQVPDPRLTQLCGKFEMSDYLSAVLEIWHRSHAAQVQEVRAALPQDTELLRLYDAAFAAWNVYYDEMLEMNQLHCRCTWGGEMYLLGIHMYSHADEWLRFIHDACVAKH